MKNQD